MTPGVERWLAEAPDWPTGKAGRGCRPRYSRWSGGHCGPLAGSTRRRDLARARLSQTGDGSRSTVPRSYQTLAPRGGDHRARPPGPHRTVAGGVRAEWARQEVMRLVLRGASTGEIGERLFVSAHTVLHYLKSVFEKTDVRSRGDLVGRLSFAWYKPRRPMCATCPAPRTDPTARRSETDSNASATAPASATCSADSRSRR